MKNSDTEGMDITDSEATIVDTMVIIIYFFLKII